MKFVTTIAVGLLLLIVFSRGCNCSSESSYTKTPLDEIIKELNSEKNFTILLYDMDVEGSFVKMYKHQYQIITEKDSIPEARITAWEEVGEDFFNKNIDNMGMEIASKQNGKLSKSISPPGYSNYIGNTHYGHWQTGSNGSSFWEFYGKYAMISSIFNLMSYPVHRSYWNDYHTHRSSGKSYYGPTSGGRKMYGTGSSFTQGTRPHSHWTSKASNQDFRQKVRNRVSRSNSKKSRSSSRYRSTSRSRSSRSFGK